MGTSPQHSCELWKPKPLQECWSFQISLRCSIPNGFSMKAARSAGLCRCHITTSTAESTPAVTTEHTQTWAPSHTLQPTSLLSETHRSVPPQCLQELCPHLAQPGATTRAINGSLHIMACGPWVTQPLPRCPWGLSLCPWISTAGKAFFYAFILISCQAFLVCLLLSVVHWCTAIYSACSCSPNSVNQD